MLLAGTARAACCRRRGPRRQDHHFFAIRCGLGLAVVGERSPAASLLHHRVTHAGETTQVYFWVLRPPFLDHVAPVVPCQAHPWSLSARLSLDVLRRPQVELCCKSATEAHAMGQSLRDSLHRGWTLWWRCWRFLFKTAPNGSRRCDALRSRERIGGHSHMRTAYLAPSISSFLCGVSRGYYIGFGVRA